MGNICRSPTAEAVFRQLVAAEGPASPAAGVRLARIFLISRLELVSFAVIIFLMVFKPGA